MDATEMHFAYNEAIRQKLDHEHSVMKNRTEWHHVVQVFLLTAFYHLYDSWALLYDKIWMLTIFGAVYALSTLYSLWISDKARSCLFMHWNRYCEENGLKWEHFPLVTGDPLPLIRGIKYDPSIFNDMNLKWYDLFLANKFLGWLKLYKFMPILFLVIWIICFFEVNPL